jgi:tRNA pseudouridine38-40 synthase
LKTWKLIIEYDGTKYSGWQEQRNARTVQGQIRKAAEEFFDGEVEIQGAGRTDAGVHARAQVAHLRVRRGVRPAKQDDQRRWPTPDQILEALNSKLPSDVCLLDVAEAAPGFHARHDAVARTYLYQISLRRTAFFKKYVWWVRRPLDVAAMSQAAGTLAGRHDFSAFRASDPSRPDESPIVVVEDAAIETQGDLIVFRITASHFVWRMVRRVIGTLVKLGLHEITPDDFSKLLEGHADPKLDVAAWTAPASGLFLERVLYAQVATGDATGDAIGDRRPKAAASADRERYRRPRR